MPPSNWDTYKQKTKNVKPWDLANPSTPKASEETANSRYEICLSCPELIQLTKQCKKCGCFMKAKTTLENAFCPLEKW